ncbi:hypothetical protein [Streptomyces spinosirectus]
MVESDPERHRGTGDDEHNRLALELAISAVVFGESAPALRARLVDSTRLKPGSADAADGATRFHGPA